MKILHYSLGFPPYRTGGMTKFCIDLMTQQNMNGHHVALMWPGQMRFVDKTVSVKNCGKAVLSDKTLEIYSFEVINPLPVSFDEGISAFQEYTKDAGRDAYIKLLDSYKPDVIHIHTLMGLHKSFMEVAKDKEIRLVFTAHDFFPICPKVTMFRHGAVCSSVHSCSECGVCNTTALGLNKIMILQSPVYRRMKDFSIVKKLRKQHRDNYLCESISDDSATPVGRAEDFRNLRSYYGSMLSLIDVIHFNSTVTKAVYETVFHLPHNSVIGITHADIVDRRRVKRFSTDNLKIRYLGPMGGGKGFFYLRRRLINYGMKDRISA